MGPTHQPVQVLIVASGLGCLFLAASTVAGVSLVVLSFVSAPRASVGEQVRVAREWARLAPLPQSATNLRSKVEGNPFTRGLRISFTAPAAEIERWLQGSPGTRDAAVERPSPRVRHFAISPGGGAQFAEVTVDDSTGEVRIHVYWG